MFIDGLRGKPELRDYKSPEKDIIKEKFNTIPYMDVWICSIIEGYIYEKVTKVNEYSDSKEEYIERYGKKEGEYEMWHPNGKIKRQEYYKEGKKEGEFKWWWVNGQLHIQCYYKEGKLDGEFKEWYDDGQLHIQCYYKEGKLDGEFKEWYEDGQLSIHKKFKDGAFVEEIFTGSAITKPTKIDRSIRLYEPAILSTSGRFRDAPHDNIFN